MLESLIDRQDHKLAGSGQLAMAQHARQIRLRACIITFIPTENFPYPICHDNPPGENDVKNARYARP
jgi:hypothetical protein